MKGLPSDQLFKLIMLVLVTRNVLAFTTTTTTTAAASGGATCIVIPSTTTKLSSSSSSRTRARRRTMTTNTSTTFLFSSSRTAGTAASSSLPLSSSTTEELLPCLLTTTTTRTRSRRRHHHQNPWRRRRRIRRSSVVVAASRTTTSSPKPGASHYDSQISSINGHVDSFSNNPEQHEEHGADDHQQAELGTPGPWGSSPWAPPPWLSSSTSGIIPRSTNGKEGSSGAGSTVATTLTTGARTLCETEKISTTTLKDKKKQQRKQCSRMLELRLAERSDVRSISRCNLLTLPENYNDQFYITHMAMWPDLALVIVEKQPTIRRMKKKKKKIIAGSSNRGGNNGMVGNIGGGCGNVPQQQQKQQQQQYSSSSMSNLWWGLDSDDDDDDGDGDGDDDHGQNQQPLQLQQQEENGGYYNNDDLDDVNDEYEYEYKDVVVAYVLGKVGQRYVPVDDKLLLDYQDDFGRSSRRSRSSSSSFSGLYNRIQFYGHITSLAVLSSHRRLGLATTLLKQLHYHMLNYKHNGGGVVVEYVSLHVRVNNTGAISLYSSDRFQYNITEILKSYYYDDGEDGYLMIKQFNYADKQQNQQNNQQHNQQQQQQQHQSSINSRSSRSSTAEQHKQQGRVWEIGSPEYRLPRRIMMYSNDDTTKARGC